MSVENWSFSSDVGNSGKSIFRLSQKKGSYFEKYWTVLVRVKSNVSLRLSSVLTRCEKIDGTTPLNSALNNLIHIPKINTVSYGNHSIRYYCAKLWNQKFRTGSFRIDANPVNDVKLCNVNSIHYFKKKLKQHFLYEYSLQ